MAGIEIEGATALVTGANRGIGRAITEALLERGAAKVYAGAPDTGQLSDLVERYGDRIEAVQLDVTDAERVAAVAAEADNVQIVVNNARGALVNLVSVGGLANFPLFPIYSASKAAARSLTQGARALLAAQEIAVMGVYPGPVDTDMAAGLEMDKSSPADVASSILDAIEAGQEDVFPDPFAVGFAEQFLSSPKESERQIAVMVTEAPVGG